MANLSSWNVTVVPSNWNTGTPAGFYYVDVALDTISTAVATSGTVSVFKMGATTTTWIALPYTQYVDASDVFYWAYNYSPGNVRIGIQNASGNSISFGGNIYFRIVVIPSTLRVANPTVNWNDYRNIEKFAGSIKVSNLQVTPKNH